MKILTLLLCILAIKSATLSNLFGQESPVKISMVRNSDKSVEFRYIKTDPGTYTVVLNFTEVTNANVMPSLDLTLKGYSGVALKLKPIDAEQHINVGYFKWNNIRGKLNPKYDNAFVYMLPYSKDAEVKATEAGFLGASHFGNTTPPDWKYFAFYTAAPAKVCAVRKGLVVEVVDTFEDDTIGNVIYTSKRNGIIIEHADGTLARYTNLKKGSITVKEGQTVYPGYELAYNSTGLDKRYFIHLGIYYLKSKDFAAQKEETLQNSKSMYGFLNPHFATQEFPDSELENQKTYHVLTSDELIRKEMTKKEIKDL